MASDGRLYFQADGLKEEVDQFKEDYGFEDRSKATRELVEVGLREQQNPILWRLKDRVVEWISLLSISAVVVFAVGAATSIYRFSEGAVAAFVLLFLASALLAGYEFGRALAGVNELGVRVRGVVATVVGES